MSPLGIAIDLLVILASGRQSLLPQARKPGPDQFGGLYALAEVPLVGVGLHLPLTSPRGLVSLVPTMSRMSRAPR